jgi:hypothetical protein
MQAGNGRFAQSGWRWLTQNGEIVNCAWREFLKATADLLENKV